MKLLNPLFLTLLLAACDAAPADPATLRVGEVCPPGCVCTCEDPSTSTTSETSTDTGSPPLLDVGSPDVGSAEGSSSTGEEMDPFIEDGPGTHSMLFGDVNNDGELDVRNYQLVYPQYWDGVSPITPLFAFHPCGNSNYNNSYYNSLHRVSNGGYFVVTPGSTGQCWDIARDGVDALFIEELIAGIEALPYVDNSQRYMAGMSSGSFMAQSMACWLGATAVVGGAGGIEYVDRNTLEVITPAPESCLGPVPIFFNNGATDTTVPFDPAALTARDFWLDNNGCEPEGVLLERDVNEPGEWCSMTENIDCPEQYYPCWPTEDLSDPANQMPCECVEYSCTEADVTFCRDAAGHEWFPQHKVAASEWFDSHQ